MRAAKVRNIGGAVTVLGVLVFLGAHLLNYLGAQGASGDTGPDVGAGLLVMLGEFIIALGVAVAVVYGVVAAVSGVFGKGGASRSVATRGPSRPVAMGSLNPDPSCVATRRRRLAPPSSAPTFRAARE